LAAAPEHVVVVRPRIVFLLVVLALAGVGALLVPPLIHQVQGLVRAVPGYVEQLTAGRGPLG
jgi:predicted PurR-regulated permease PerM